VAIASGARAPICGRSKSRASWRSSRVEIWRLPGRVEYDLKTAAFATICCNYGTNASPKLYLELVVEAQFGVREKLSRPRRAKRVRTAEAGSSYLFYRELTSLSPAAPLARQQKSRTGRSLSVRIPRGRGRRRAEGQSRLEDEPERRCMPGATLGPRNANFSELCVRLIQVCAPTSKAESSSL
jgi:hypothetical protein